jgi:hypothetical protein
VSARLLVILCLIVAGAGTCAESPSAVTKPIEAELLSRLNARSLKPGDSIYARVVRDWNGPGCHLRRGATLEATVRMATLRSHAARSQVALGFERAECGDAGLEPFRLELEAMAAPSDAAEIPADLPNPATLGVQTISLRQYIQHIDSPADLKTGEVRGLKRLHLSVAAGPERSTVLIDRDGDVQLDPHTRLFMRPARANLSSQPSQPGTPAAVAFLQDSPVTSLPSEDDDAGSDLDACAPADCSAASTDAAEQRTYSGSIPLRELGYVSRLNREILAPSDDEALAWLSPSQLLVTFNRHLLVPRYTSSSSDHTVRIIRAVLIDVSSRTVKQTLDWHVSDRRQFLWLLPGNRVLAHVGDELRVYSAGLRVERRITLAGPLAFARVSPDGRIIAIGVVRERHTPALHASLAASLDRDPDEDAEVVLMNDRFETLGAALGNSDAAPPVLLNEGQVKAVAAPGQSNRAHKRYALQLRTWDDNTRILGRFQSSCVAEISSLPPDLLFIVSCGKASGAREYRVVRSDGKPLLHGFSYLKELGHAASGGGSPATFALRIFKADSPMLPGEPFHAADLESAELIIYRCEDGKRLTTVHVKDPAASSAGYAVSSAGEVAILTRDDVDIYSVPRK